MSCALRATVNGSLLSSIGTLISRGNGIERFMYFKVVEEEIIFSNGGINSSQVGLEISLSKKVFTNRDYWECCQGCLPDEFSKLLSFAKKGGSTDLKAIAQDQEGNISSLEAIVNEPGEFPYVLSFDLKGTDNTCESFTLKRQEYSIVLKMKTRFLGDMLNKIKKEITTLNTGKKSSKGVSILSGQNTEIELIVIIDEQTVEQGGNNSISKVYIKGSNNGKFIRNVLRPLYIEGSPLNNISVENNQIPRSIRICFVIDSLCEILSDLNRKLPELEDISLTINCTYDEESEIFYEPLSLLLMSDHVNESYQDEESATKDRIDQDSEISPPKISFTGCIGIKEPEAREDDERPCFSIDPEDELVFRELERTVATRNELTINNSSNTLGKRTNTTKKTPTTPKKKKSNTVPTKQLSKKSTTSTLKQSASTLKQSASTLKQSGSTLKQSASREEQEEDDDDVLFEELSNQEDSDDDISVDYI